MAAPRYLMAPLCGCSGAGDITAASPAASADRTFCDDYVVGARGGDGEHDLDAAHDVVERHRRGALLPCCLAGQIGHMQKPAAQTHLAARDQMHEPIEDMLADEGPGGIRDDRR